MPEGVNWTPFEDLDTEPEWGTARSRKPCANPLSEWYRETPLPLARPLALRGDGTGSGSSGSSRSESSWGLDEFREL